MEEGMGSTSQVEGIVLQVVGGDKLVAFGRSA